MDRHERVSALIDNEVSDFEIRQILNEMLQDDKQKASWTRFHIIRDTLQGNLPGTIRAGFADNVMSHIYASPEFDSTHSAVDDAASLQGTRSKSVRNHKPVYGVALAASLALVAVLVYQLQPVLDSPSATVAPQIADVTSTQPTPNVQTQQTVPQEQTQVIQADYATLSPFDNNALSSYLMNHAEYAGSQGMIPHARIVGYDISDR